MTTYAGRRAATAWTVHGAPAVRDATTAATIFTPAPQVPNPGPRPDRARTQPVDPQAQARQQVFDALMQAQRIGWDQQPPWNGGDDQ